MNECCYAAGGKPLTVTQEDFILFLFSKTDEFKIRLVKLNVPVFTRYAQKHLCPEVNISDAVRESSGNSALSLNEWMPWQSRLQASFVVSHSDATKDFVESMEFMDVQSKPFNAVVVELDDVKCYFILFPWS